MRDAVDAEPRLFADLSTLDASYSNFDAETFSWLLRRSGNHPLQLAVPVPLRDAAERSGMLAATIEVLPRTQALCLGVIERWADYRDPLTRSYDQQWYNRGRVQYDREAWRDVSRALQEPAPRLQRLLVHSLSGEEARINALPIDLFANHAPMLRSCSLSGVHLPLEYVPALSTLREFVYEPPSNTLHEADLRRIMRGMPYLETLEIEVYRYRAADPSTITDGADVNTERLDNLRTLRLGHAPTSLEQLLDFILPLAPKLEALVMYDDGDELVWLTRVVKAFPFFRKLRLVNFWLEAEMARSENGRPVTLRVFSDEDPTVFTFRNILKRLPVDHLVELVIHEHHWPEEDRGDEESDEDDTDEEDSSTTVDSNLSSEEASGTSSMPGGWDESPATSDAGSDSEVPDTTQPPVLPTVSRPPRGLPVFPELHHLHIILASTDDYLNSQDLDEDFEGVLYADGRRSLGRRMPQLEHITIEHGLRLESPCIEYLRHVCNCNVPMPVSLRDVKTLIEDLAPATKKKPRMLQENSKRLRKVVLRGLDPVDMDEAACLRELGELAVEVEVQEMVPPPSEGYKLEWPGDPRAIFTVWS